MPREALAGKIGRCASTIKKWENGESQPLASDLLHMEAVQPGLVAALLLVKLSRRRVATFAQEAS